MTFESVYLVRVIVVVLLLLATLLHLRAAWECAR